MGITFLSNSLTLVAFAALGALWWFAIGLMTNTFPPDLSALYMAGHFYAEGSFDLIYAAPEGFFGGPPPAWEADIRELGWQDLDVVPYVYPPLWAAILAVLVSLVSPSTFFNLAAVLQITLIAGSVILAWRIARPFAIPLWAWIMLSVVLLASSIISFTAVYHLQPQITVVFLILLTFERYGAKHFATAGALLALAAMLKLAPAGLVLIFLIDRNWRAISSFAAVLGAMIAVSLFVTGIEMHQEFLGSVSAASSGLFLTSITYSVEPFLHFMAGLLDHVPAMDPMQRNIRIETKSIWVGILSKILFLVALIWMLHRTSDLPDKPRLLARLIGLSTLLNLFGPLGWAHYYLLQLMLLPALVGLMRMQTGFFFVGLVAVLTSWPMFKYLQSTVQGDLVLSLVGTTTMLLLFIVISQVGRRARIDGTV